ncbi:hypothetical protein ACJX0J_032741, partial [Zea mays]
GGSLGTSLHDLSKSYGILKLSEAGVVFAFLVQTSITFLAKVIYMKTLGDMHKMKGLFGLWLTCDNAWLPSHFLESSNTRLSSSSYGRREDKDEPNIISFGLKVARKIQGVRNEVIFYSLVGFKIRIALL